jgi:DNA-binding transcriptional ArsR family regulator
VQVEPAVLAAIASPRRCEILRLVWDRECAAGAIHNAMPDVSFGAVSLHLRALRDAGLVTCRQDHRHRYYRTRSEALGPLAPALAAMWDTALGRLKLQAEMEARRRGPRPRRRQTRKATRPR